MAIAKNRTAIAKPQQRSQKLNSDRAMGVRNQHLLETKNKNR